MYSILLIRNNNRPSSNFFMERIHIYLSNYDRYELARLRYIYVVTEFTRIFTESPQLETISFLLFRVRIFRLHKTYLIRNFAVCGRRRFMHVFIVKIGKNSNEKFTRSGKLYLASFPVPISPPRRLTTKQFTTTVLSNLFHVFAISQIYSQRRTNRPEVAR